MSDMQEQLIIKQIKHWLETVVIGLNFCPFAKKEFDKQTIRYCLAAHTAENDSSLQQLIDELTLLNNDSSIETTLLIYPQAYQDFNDYLDWLELAETLVEQGGYRGIYQLASFHPDYCFAGEESDDPANFTNRAPYPIIHILREASLAKVLKSYKDPDAIPARNIAKARQLGNDYFKKLLE